MNPTTVTIFGVFDGIHDGHLQFIKEASSEAERLVAIVARDSEVFIQKGKHPLNDEVSRINSLLKVPDIDLVYLGDLQQGTYHILKEISPNIVYLGYDQEALAKSIKKAITEGILPAMEIKFGQPYKPEVFKSSIINRLTEK